MTEFADSRAELWAMHHKQLQEAWRASIEENLNERAESTKSALEFAARACRTELSEAKSTWRESYSKRRSEAKAVKAILTSNDALWPKKPATTEPEDGETRAGVAQMFITGVRDATERAFRYGSGSTAENRPGSDPTITDARTEQEMALADGEASDAGDRSDETKPPGPLHGGTNVIGTLSQEIGHTLPSMADTPLTTEVLRDLARDLKEFADQPPAAASSSALTKVHTQVAELLEDLDTLKSDDFLQTLNERRKKRLKILQDRMRRNGERLPEAVADDLMAPFVDAFHKRFTVQAAPDREEPDIHERVKDLKAALSWSDANEIFASLQARVMARIDEEQSAASQELHDIALQGDKDLQDAHAAILTQHRTLALNAWDESADRLGEELRERKAEDDAPRLESSTENAAAARQVATEASEATAELEQQVVRQRADVNERSIVAKAAEDAVEREMKTFEDVRGTPEAEGISARLTTLRREASAQGQALGAAQSALAETEKNLKAASERQEKLDATAAKQEQEHQKLLEQIAEEARELNQEIGNETAKGRDALKDALDEAETAQRTDTRARIDAAQTDLMASLAKWFSDLREEIDGPAPETDAGADP